MKRKGKRIGTLLLAVSLLFGQLGGNAFAEGTEKDNGGLCKHHPAHTTDCGYLEGRLCGHEHTADCYTDELICGYDDGDTQTASGNDAAHEHTRECYALDCPHERGEHDDTCGYAEARPCGYLCDICNPKDSGGDDLDSNPPPANPLPGAAVIRIAGFDELETAEQNRLVPAGTEQADLDLPATLGASGYTVGEDTEPAAKPLTVEGVTWKIDPDNAINDGNSAYRPESGSYCFTPVLPDRYALESSVTLPEIHVKIGGQAANDTLTAGPDDSNGDSYHDGDVAVVNAIIKNNGLSATDDNPSSWGNFVTWDGSTPKRITDLTLFGKGLSGTLDVSGLSSLKVLTCFSNELTRLNLPSGLTKLYCSNNQLKSLDLLHVPALNLLECNNNQLETLDLSHVTELSVLNCSENQLKSLDLSHVPGLTELYFNNNQLESLNLSHVTKLGALNCSENQLKSLDLSHTTRLYRLVCNNNQLKALDLSHVTGLVYLHCTDNQLKSLDLSHMSALETLFCYNNQLESLNLPSSSNLSTLYCNNNQLKSLDLSNFNSNYSDALYCGNNPLTSFIAPNNKKKLTINATEGGSVIVGSNDPNVQNNYGYEIASRTVHLTVTQESGYTIKEWKAEPDEVIISNNQTRFTLDKDITITAGFTDSDDATLKSLSLSAGALSPAFDPAVTGYTATVDVSSVTINAKANDAYATVSDDGTKPLNMGANTFTVTVTAEDGATTMSYTLTITRVEPAPNNSNNSGSDTNDDSSSGNTATARPTAPPKPDAAAIGVITIAKADKYGGVEISSEQMTDALNKAADAQKSGNKKGGISAAINLPAGATSATLDRAALDKLTDSGAKSLQLDFDGMSMRFDLAALKAVASQTTGAVTFGVQKAEGLNGEALAAISDRPAYEFTVIGQKDGKPVKVTSFGAGRVTLTFSYDSAENERMGGLYLVRAGEDGDVTWLHQSSYNADTKRLIGVTSRFSTYGVGYKAPPAFTDTANHWAKDAIDFAATRGLLTGETAFNPDAPLTRDAFVTALGRLAGIDPAAYASSGRFTDVPANANYAPYVEWAADKGIVNGTGEKTFSPDTTITREQMAAIMQRYADKLGYTLPVTHEAEIFADENQTGTVFKTSVQAMQQAGVMNGKGGHRFAPKNTATRAEAAAVLRRFVEVVIDPATAEGWAQNDAGSWLYYEKHKPVTGWKQIESKWYYFYPDGAMAMNTKIDGYEVGPDGARKE